MKSILYLLFSSVILTFALSCEKESIEIEIFEPGTGGAIAIKSGEEWEGTPFLRRNSNPNNAWYCKDFYSLDLNTYNSDNEQRENIFFYTFPLLTGKYKVVRDLDSSLISCEENLYHVKGKYFRLTADGDVLAAVFNVSDKEESYFWIDEVKDSTVLGRFELYFDNDDTFDSDFIKLPDQLRFKNGEFEAKIQ